MTRTTAIDKPNESSEPATPRYQYQDSPCPFLLRMIPEDGHVVGSIGCGWGATEAVLAKQGRQVHGVDTSAEAIEVARTRLTSARVVSPDDSRPFDPESLDGLILGDVLEHIPQAWERLRAYTECVRPNGWVVISVPNMHYATALYQFLLRGDWPEHAVGIFDRTHLQVMTRRRLVRWCKMSGLQVERWFDRYGKPGTLLGRIYQAGDYMSFRLFHNIFTVQLQCRCRKL
jgi:2-polyprenyl-3-methyl-5-hydroxy-6-metoxy-1,4-benzoquinol methylase